MGTRTLCMVLPTRAQVSVPSAARVHAHRAVSKGALGTEGDGLQRAISVLCLSEGFPRPQVIRGHVQRRGVLRLGLSAVVRLVRAYMSSRGTVAASRRVSSMNFSCIYRSERRT